MALDIDTDGFRRASELVDAAGTVLNHDLGEDVAACGGDEVSQTLMENLNTRRGWLAQHVRAGSRQASNAAIGMDATATAYQTEDLAAAARYPGGASAAPAAPSVAAPGMHAASPTGSPPQSAIPDISGRDGEQLARALESGAGPGPAAAAAARLNALAAQATAANTTLVAAHTQLLASGESAAHEPLLTRLTRAIAWTQAVAGQAEALAAGYLAAGTLHTATMGSVGPSTWWRTTKTAYSQAVMENQLTGLAQAKVDALQTALLEQQQQSGAAMNTYQSSGEAVSTPPGAVPDPGLDPNSDSAAGDDLDGGDKDHDTGTGDKTPPGTDDIGGMQDMLSPLMGAVSPLAQSLGQANPLQSLGQVAQQLAQQAGSLGSQAAKKAASAPIKPAALAKPGASANKGGTGGKPGGGSPIKPAASLSGAVRAASLTGTPESSPPLTPMKPAAAAGAATASGVGGMGMMPMGHRPGDTSKSSKVTSYEQPLPEVQGAGREGVVGDSAKPTPVVNPEAQDAVKARIARRRKDTAISDDG